ncbi:MAG: oligosaccharide flippase family protein [Bradymonadaceae bacterium]|nr:oligosaccharide flippase family protein [Lujinxingiaceae bacterium]
MALTLRRNIAWTLAGNSVYAACQWAIVVVLARLAGPEGVGRFALALAVAAPVMILANLSLRQVQITDAHQSHPFSDYLFVRLLTSLIGLVLIAAIALIGYSAETAAVIVAVGLSKAFEAMSDIFYGLEQRNERLDLVSKSLILRGVLGLVALVAGYFFTNSLIGGVIAMSAAWAGVWWLYDLPASRPWWQYDSFAAHCKPQRAKARLALVGLAAPLGVAAMFVSLNANIPRYFIEHYLGEQALGIFAAMAYLIIAGGMVIGAIGQAASPRLANYFAAGELRAFVSLLARMVLIALVVGLLGVAAAMLFGRQILTLMYGEAFAANLEAFVWVMVAATLTYLTSCLGYGMTAMRYFRVQPVLFVVICAISALACYLLIPPYGLLGAVWAFAVALGVQLSLTLVINLYGLSRAASLGSKPSS